MNDDISLISAAHCWYGIHAAEHLAHDCDRMIDRCTKHLVTSRCVAESQAKRIAALTLAEREASDATGYLDIDHTTDRMAVINDTTRHCVYHLTIAELLHYCRLRASPAG